MTATTVDNDTLLTLYSLALGDVEQARLEAGRLEQEIMRRMREQDAIAIPSERFTCELEVRNTYDASRFLPLKELLSSEDLRSVFEPAHQEMVNIPDKWNTQKLLALARRYGGDAKRVVEEAKVPGAPRLKFSEKH